MLAAVRPFSCMRSPVLNKNRLSYVRLVTLLALIWLVLHVSLHVFDKSGLCFETFVTVPADIRPLSSVDPYMFPQVTGIRKALGTVLTVERTVHTMLHSLVVYQLVAQSKLLVTL